MRTSDKGPLDLALLALIYSADLKCEYIISKHVMMFVFQSVCGLCDA